MGVADKGISFIHWLILAVNIYYYSYYCVPKFRWCCCLKMKQPLLSCPSDLELTGCGQDRELKHT